MKVAFIIPVLSEIDLTKTYNKINEKDDVNEKDLYRYMCSPFVNDGVCKGSKFRKR